MAIITPLFFLIKHSKSVKKALTPGLITSIFLSILYILVRRLTPLCHFLPVDDDKAECSFDWRDMELFMFFMCLMVLKFRTAISVQQMINTTLMYSKIASVVLFYRLDARLGVAYFLLCLARVWLLPENFVEGPEEIIYFSDKTLEEALEENPKVTWIVEFYTTWSPPCHAAMPAFAAVSNEYATDFMRFGKIDVGKYPEAAAKYGVNTSTLSRQLPTVMIFENRKPVDWRPMIGSNKKFIKYVFSEENMKRDFNLDKLHEESIAKSKTRKQSKKDK